MSAALPLLAGILVAGVAAHWLAWRTQLPAILFLLAAGLLAGPVTGVLDPDALFGELLFPVVSLAVAVILFEGALTLRFRDIRGLAGAVWNLVTLGAGVTWGVMAVAAHWLVGLDLELALLFGALVVVTGPTVIVPMIRTVRPTQRVANTLRWEGIVIDPLGAILAVLVYQVVIARHTGDGDADLVPTLLTMVVVGTVLGFGAGRALAVALRRHWLPEYLHNVITLAAVAGVYAVSDLLMHESGLLAVTVMGVTMANTRRAEIDDILDFKESLSLLLIAGLFIVLGARLELDRLLELGPAALGVLAVLMLVARPLAVALSTLGSELTRGERALVAWIGPRGIVAAAISAAFALRLEEAGVAQAAVLVPLTFVIIVGTVVIQGATAGPLARWLGVAEPEPRGVLIVGASPFARRFGQALEEAGFPVMMCDTHWENVREARMAGLPAFYGSPVSEHADRHLDLVGLGRLVALSPSPQLNALACLRYAQEFGRGRVYALAQGEAPSARSARSVSGRPGYTLFGEELTFGRLASRVHEGDEIRRTRLTESFGFDDYLAANDEDILPLFAVTPEGRLRFFLCEQPPRPDAGWTVAALAPPRLEEALAKGNGAEADTAPALPADR